MKMGNVRGVVVVPVVFVVALALLLSQRAAAAGEPFDTHYRVIYGEHHVNRINNGDIMEFWMDKSTGAGFTSKTNYSWGLFDMKIKLPTMKKTKGVITTYYLTSHGKNHTEIDFEFIGTKILQTNIFINDIGNREQRVNLWFDATADFHSYKILWNANMIGMYVDNVPIRVLRRKPNQPYLTKPMTLLGTLWSAPDWAGEVDWNEGPFRAQYQAPFDLDGCPVQLGPKCDAPTWKWNKIQGLSPKQQIDYKKFLPYRTYDYCNDKTREPHPIPNECRDRIV